MQPDPQLVAAIYREKIIRARNMPPEEKLMAGAKLYEYARSICEAGIKNQHPTATPEDIRREFQRRLSIGRKLEMRR